MEPPQLARCHSLVLGAALLVAALSISAPPPAPNLVPRATRERIRRTISKSISRIGDCAMKSESRTGRLPNKVFVKFTIRPDNSVVDVAVEEPSRDPEYDTCVVRVFESLKLGDLELERSVDVRYPLLLCFAAVFSAAPVTWV